MNGLLCSCSFLGFSRTVSSCCSLFHFSFKLSFDFGVKWSQKTENEIPLRRAGNSGFHSADLTRQKLSTTSGSLVRMDTKFMLCHRLPPYIVTAGNSKCLYLAFQIGDKLMILSIVIHICHGEAVAGHELNGNRSLSLPQSCSQSRVDHFPCNAKLFSFSRYFLSINWNPPK